MMVGNRYRDPERFGLLQEKIERLQAELEQLQDFKNEWKELAENRAAQNAKLREAIRNVQKAAVHGMYGESPETDIFDDALHELYALAAQEDK